jgi:hypothetical protein
VFVSVADAALFETVCQIRGDELVHHIRVAGIPDEQALRSCTCGKLKQLLIWDLGLASK